MTTIISIANGRFALNGTPTYADGRPHDQVEDRRPEEELIEGLPFLDIHLVRQDGWDELVGAVFATDRRLNPKGMIEVVSWN